MSKSDRAAHVLLSLIVGASVTTGLLFLVMLTDPEGCGSRTPVLERHPFAWVLLWPEVLVKGMDVILISNAVLYSALTYFVLYRRNRPLKLP